MAWRRSALGLLIAACANLGNLFDRAPGRTIKVTTIVAGVAVALGGPAWQLSGMALVVGAGAGMLVPDLRERCMLGDTGSERARGRPSASVWWCRSARWGSGSRSSW